MTVNKKFHFFMNRAVVKIRWSRIIPFIAVVVLICGTAAILVAVILTKNVDTITNSTTSGIVLSTRETYADSFYT